jgi:hypothetical protein
MPTETEIPLRPCAYRVLRYTPNLVRDEWLNIGVLVYDPATGERRLRLIEEESEYARVRRLHPGADESLLRALRDDIENRFATASILFPPGADGKSNVESDWLKLLAKWDDTLSNVLQLAPQKGTYAADLDSETERLYGDQVAVSRPAGRPGVPDSRSALRSYCAQVFRQARVWDRLQRGVRAEEFTFPGDPMRLDFAYRRNGTRGFVQTISVSRAPADAKLLAYTVGRIREKIRSSEFTAVTDVALAAENKRHRFVSETLRDAGVESVPVEAFAVWTAKLRPMIQ